MESGAQGGHPINGAAVQKKRGGKALRPRYWVGEFQHTLQEDLRNLTNSEYFIFLSLKKVL